MCVHVHLCTYMFLCNQIASFAKYAHCVTCMHICTCIVLSCVMCKRCSCTYIYTYAYVHTDRCACVAGFVTCSVCGICAICALCTYYAFLCTLCTCIYTANCLYIPCYVLIYYIVCVLCMSRKLFLMYDAQYGQQVQNLHIMENENLHYVHVHACTQVLELVKVYPGALGAFLLRVTLANSKILGWSKNFCVRFFVL